MSITIRTPITGGFTVIEHPLLPEHIKVGTIFWYTGITSTSIWHCPGKIIEVDESKQLFRFLSFHDMHERDDWYAFDRKNDMTSSRQGMRIPEIAEVTEYLTERHRELEVAAQRAKRMHTIAEENVARFNKVRTALKL